MLLVIIEKKKKEKERNDVILLLIIKIKRKYYDIGRIDKFYWIKCYGIKRILRKFIE